MTTAASRCGQPGNDSQERIVGELQALLDPDFLTTMGWSAQRRILYFPPGDPLFGRRYCVVPRCGVKAENPEQVCYSCRNRWAKSGEPLAAFATRPRPVANTYFYGECLVPGCKRPYDRRFQGLCRAHHGERAETGKLSVERFVVSPGVSGLESIGPCAVAACTRERYAESSHYCHVHDRRWNELMRASDSDPGPDEQRFRRVSAAVPFSNECSLRGLPERVVVEVLIGLQQRAFVYGAKTCIDHARRVITALLDTEATSLEELDSGPLTESAQILHKQMRLSVRRALATPESERLKDDWDATVFGFTGVLRFGKILQPWLREAAKIWAYNELPQRRSDNAKAAVQSEMRALVMLSESLWLQRPADHGNDPRLLTRSDLCGWLNRMAFLVAGGVTTARMRRVAVVDMRRILAKMRALGLTRSDQPLHGLSDEFAVHLEDIPRREDPDREGRDLPVEVMRHLCAHLDDLEKRSSREVRVAVELLIDTGRRPDEICQLPVNCLDRDGQGKPVLVYTNFKSNRPGSRLPITEATAAVIMAQQQRVRDRFPTAADKDLKLICSSVRNPHGSRPFNDSYVATKHHEWAMGLPDIMVAMPVAVAGKTVIKQVPFDKSRVFLYAYRHTYTQRHADAGVPIDVLCELMGHRSITTTQSYYSVGEQRRREAVDRLTTMHFDRHGNKLWREAETLLDSEHVRRAVGEVAVPYGNCSEPSNVAAGGNDCPVRFRCIGCAHYSTDVSYLPDLENYLSDLLRSRERLRSAAADDWAKSEAMPSDEEVTRIRRLITRIKADIDDLSREQREQVEEAAATVRCARNRMVGLGLPRIRQPLPDIRPDRSA